MPLQSPDDDRDNIFAVPLPTNALHQYLVFICSYSATFEENGLVQKNNRGGGGIISRGIGTYFLCLAAFYFYDKATTGGAETHQLGIVPYIVISLWFGWIFFHNRVLLRKLAFTKKITAYLLCLATGIAVVSLVQQQIVLAAKGTIRPLAGILLSISFYTLLGVLVFLAFEYLRNQKDFYQLHSMKKEIELQQLKTQLNPHFLFNALNNIYSYNIENNQHGNDLILKLGQLMRFIVEVSQQQLIPLHDEIMFMENYIAFEKERLGDRCKIHYLKNLSPGNRNIPPLLFFPFIENAFKHGTNTIRPTQISISLEETRNILTLTVKNELTGHAIVSTKTGLVNIARRLELLYPGKHQLNIATDSNHYTIQLNIYL